VTISLAYHVAHTKCRVQGIVLGVVRVSSQLATISSIPLEDEIHAGQKDGIVPSFPLDLKPGRPSPLGSTALGAMMLRFKLGCADEQDLFNLYSAVGLALKQETTFEMRGHQMGGDEVLFGRAGLLSAMLEIKKEASHTQQGQSDGPGAEISRKIAEFANNAIPKLTRTIVQAGKEGGDKMLKSAADPGSACPISWPWIDSYYSLGAMHGITGILAVLLDPQISTLDGEIREYYSDIADSISALCRVCLETNGNLPASIPPWPSDSTRSSPLVQICHGTPSLLLLLAAAALNVDFSQQFYKSEWIDAIYSGAQRVWENGILSKGGSLCHGIAGNAWPLLMLHDCFEYGFIPLKSFDGCSEEVKATFLKEKRSTGDWLLSRAVVMLQECSSTRPFGTDEKYRMPDHPYSLFEGLAGTLCAWTEAILALLARIDRLDAFERGELDFPKSSAEDVKAKFVGSLRARRGFPGIGIDFSCYEV